MENSILSKFSGLKNDQIGDGIYIAFQWSAKRLCRIYIGSKQCGPMLQYEAYDNANYKDRVIIEIAETTTLVEHGTLYNGHEQVTFLGGAWTNLYSRGNFGRKYACGGNWTGHTKNKHPRLMLSPIKDKKSEFLVDGDNNIMNLPAGIKGDIGVTQVDCSGAWSIFYQTAKEAIENRLTGNEIAESTLIDPVKQHLLKNQTLLVLDALSDVIEAYNL